MTLPTDQAQLNHQLYRLIFNQVPGLTIGEAVLRAKAASSNADVNPDVDSAWRPLDEVEIIGLRTSSSYLNVTVLLDELPEGSVQYPSKRLSPSQVPNQR